MSTLQRTLDSLWQPGLLAALLRGRRITLVVGVPHPHAPALPRSALRALLGRRRADRPGASSHVPEATRSADAERRGDERIAEVAVFVDPASPSPLLSWVDSLRRALPAGTLPFVGSTDLGAALREASRALGGARLLFVFDHFERCLSAEETAAREFADALVEVLADPTLPAHFLIVLRAEDDARLDTFRRRIPGFGDHVVHVTPLYASPAPPPPAAPPAPPAGARAAAAGLRRAAPMVVVAAGVALVAGTLGAISLRSGSERVSPSVANAVQPVAPPARSVAAAAPMIRLTAPAESHALAAELAAALPRQGVSVQLEAPMAPAEAFMRLAAAGDAPHYAIVRDDMLRRLHAGGGAQALRVITPLMLHDVHAVVRADSPWRHLHQIVGRRLDIGAPGSAREHTALTLYQLLADGEDAAVRSEHRGDAQALAALLAGGGAEVVLLVGAQPLEALEKLAPAERRRLRLLALHPRHPSTARALQVFVTSRVAGSTPTLAAMTWLVGAADGEANDAALVRALCRARDTLRQGGGSRWRVASLGSDLPAPIRTSATALVQWERCGDEANPRDTDVIAVRAVARADRP